MSGNFAVSLGDVLQLIVGDRGSDGPDSRGGGSGVVRNAVPLVVAGGSAGVDYQQPTSPNIDATTSENGNAGTAIPRVQAVWRVERAAV